MLTYLDQIPERTLFIALYILGAAAALCFAAIIILEATC